MKLDPKLSRRVVGLMSGTSLDGVDAALVEITGSGEDVSIETLAFISRSYPSPLRALLFKNSSPDTSSVLEISQLNVRLAVEYAGIVRDVVETAGLTLADIDTVGCHGQTVYHVPDAADCAGVPTRSTLQLGDPSTLANLLGVPVVGDFRLADMAVGGQGAPLASYFDYVYFASDDEHRALLNIGGIGNVSVIPRACSPDDVFAFDTGPGNMVIDSVVKRLYNEPFDEGGRRASEGSVHQGLLDALLADAYYELEPPKTTGRELYNTAYVDGLFEKAAQLNVTRPEDLVTTATTLTVETIARSCESFILPHVKIDRMIVSGGGVHNRWMMNQLAQRLPSMEVLSASELGLNADAKEAMFFALFAHETLNGMPSNIPSATGASRPAILGKICLP